MPTASRFNIHDLFANSSRLAGPVLMAAAGLGLLVANSPLSPWYFNLLETQLAGISVLHWINEGLMAVFFLQVGLEIKREILVGKLSAWPQRILPAAAALGGMIGPALVFLALNLGAGGQPSGWAIPAATDIVFALGVLGLLGSRVPVSLKVFLLALAIMDDLGAVLIITLFYSANIHVVALAAAAVVCALLIVLNRRGVTTLFPYLALGIVLWICVLDSGVQAAVSGVILAITMPFRRGASSPEPRSPMIKVEHAIAPWVTLLVVPLFAFANAGVSFAGVTVATLWSPVPLGVACGLFLGKQLGVLCAAAIVIRTRWARMPAQASWRQLYGVSLLCGIGFTMSLFIGLAAFPAQAIVQDGVKLGVFAGSAVAAVAGVIVLLTAGAARTPAERRINNGIGPAMGIDSATRSAPDPQEHSMQILTNSDGHRGGSEALSATVSGMIEAALGRFSGHITRVEVHMSDQNGSKGGKDDKRCVLEAHVEGRKPVAVVENAANMKQAVQGAIDKLVRMLDSTVGKMNEHRRNMPDASKSEVDPA